MLRKIVFGCDLTSYIVVMWWPNRYNVTMWWSNQLWLLWWDDL